MPANDNYPPRVGENSISGSSYSMGATETETTVETIEYEYDANGMVSKETRTRKVTKPSRGGWGASPWTVPAAPAPFPPYRHPVWYEQGGRTGDVRPNWSYTNTRLSNNTKDPSLPK